MRSAAISSDELAISRLFIYAYFTAFTRRPSLSDDDDDDDGDDGNERALKPNCCEPFKEHRRTTKNFVVLSRNNEKLSSTFVSGVKL
jgi:hypothetical protein